MCWGSRASNARCQFDRKVAPGRGHQQEDRLVLIADGIVEAQNACREMFGFGCIRTLISKQVSAAEIANARAFGKQGDISMLAIARMPVTTREVS